MAKKTNKSKESQLDKVFNAIRSKLSKPSINKTLDDVDAILSRISTDVISKDSRNYAEMLRRLVSGGLSTETFKDVGPEILQGPDTIGRLFRYGNSEEIVDSIPHCTRALNVLSDEIISPDDYTKETLKIFSKSKGETEEVKEAIDNFKTINNHLGVENFLHILIKDTLKLGDQFVEICDYTSPDVPVTQSLLNEDAFKDEMESLKDKKYTISLIKEGKDVEDNDDIDKKEREITLEILENDFKLIEEKGKSGIKLENVRLMIHDPRYIIKIQSQRFRMCLGYLILPKSLVIGNLGAPVGALPGFGTVSAYSHSQAGFVTGVDKLYQDILKILKARLNNNEISVNKKELQDLLARCLIGADENDLRLRYVPPERIEHFTLESTRFFPYGESMFYKVTFAAKLLISMETALAVKRMSDSSEKRIMYVESSLPRNVTDIINEIKEQLHKRRYSLDSFGSIGAIPSMITSYEDIYIPQYNGRRYVEFDQLAPKLQIRDTHEELKFMRDQLVSALGIPPPFIGIEENLCTSLNTIIPMTCGKRFTLQKIIDMFESGDTEYLEVYSYDEGLGVVFPNKIKWAGKTRLNTELIRVHLDNDKYIDCTPDHPFLLRDGKTYVQAKDLKEGDSLLPFYTKNDYRKTKRGNYKLIYHPGLDVWNRQTISFSDYWGIINKYDKNIIHHINTNPIDDRICNLIAVSPAEHMTIHSRIKEYSIDELNSLVSEDRNRSKELKKHGVSAGLESRKCEICGKEFFAMNDINQTTCSIKCRREKRRQTGYNAWKVNEKNLNKECNHYHFSCVGCGKDVYIRTRRQLDSNRFYSCGNPECGKIAKKINTSRTAWGGKNYFDIYFINCEICGKLTIQSDQDKSKKLKTVCRDIRCINTYNARNSAMKRRKRKIYICPICGDKFERQNYYEKSIKHQMTCGKAECYNKNMSNINNKRASLKLKDQSKVTVLNHTVTKIERLIDREDTGDIQVEGIYHNFATVAGVFIHNSNKSALSHENILFARTIVNHQAKFGKHILSLFRKIHILVYKKELSSSVNIQLPKPKMLQLEREAEHVETIGRVVNSLAELGLPKEYLIKKYLLENWDEVEVKKIEEELEKKATAPAEGEEAGFGGGPAGY